MRRIAFQFGPVLIALESLAAPLFDDVISRHGGEWHPKIYRVAIPIGCKVVISDEFRAKNPDDAKLIDAGNVLMDRALKDGEKDLAVSTGPAAN